MADDTDPVWSFLNALPASLRARINRTERLVVLIHKAIAEHGLTPKQLAVEAARDQNGAINGGALVMFRLERAAEHGLGTVTTHRRIHFGCCEAGWLYPDDGDPVKCPGNQPAEVKV